MCFMVYKNLQLYRNFIFEESGKNKNAFKNAYCPKLKIRVYLKLKGSAGTKQSKIDNGLKLQKRL